MQEMHRVDRKGERRGAVLNRQRVVVGKSSH